MTLPSCRVLLVEDNRPDALLIEEMLLKSRSVIFELVLAEKLKKALDLVNGQDFDAILLDLSLPDSQGLATLDRLQHSAPSVPVVIVTGHEDEQLAIDAIRQGAQDYLVKGFLDTRVVARSIQYAIDRKQSEQALRASEQRFKLLSGTAGRLLEATDPQAVVNELCLEVMKYLDCQVFFNYLKDEHSGRLRLNACAGISRKETHKIEWLDTGVAVCGCVARDGSPIVVHDVQKTPDPRTDLVKSYGTQAYCCHPLNAQNEVIGTLSFGTTKRPHFSTDEIAVMKTVADQVALAIQKILSQRALKSASDAKDRFMAALSHELRTPLTPALTGVEALLDNPDLPPSARECLMMIQRNIGLEVRLIDDLLDVTRVAQGKLKLDRNPLDAAALVREAAAICEPDLKAKRQTLTIHTEGVAFPIMADGPRLHQVFWNLFKNAAKFTPEGGVISAKCSLQKEGRRAVRIDIQDNGAGIEQEMLDTIFAPFEQGPAAVTSGGGLGLGLTICKAVVEMHGGSIRAFSKGRGQGSTFTVELPISGEERRAERRVGPADLPRAEQTATRPLRILLVEDHADTAYFMAREIRRKGGHEVKTAGSVKEALTTLADDCFDLLVCDLGLPDGSGHDLMRQIQAGKRTIPGLALSGYCMPEDERRSLEAGFTEHLTKPITIDRLLDSMHRVANKLATPARQPAPL